MPYENLSIPLIGAGDQLGFMQLIRDGRVVLPRFQRSFVWKEDDVRKLLCTVGRNWPAGTLLLATEMPGFEPLPLFRMGEVAEEPKYWVLDGQQRLTALALIYRGLYPTNSRSESSKVVSLDLAKVREDGKVEPEHFEFHSHSAWAKQFPNIASQAARRIVNLKDFLQFEQPNYNYWNDWLQGVPDETERAEYVRVQSEDLSGLFQYRFPVLEIGSGTSWEEIVWIFEHINRQGKALGPWDLVHARTWLPDGAFSLVESWKEWEWRIGLPQRSVAKRYDPCYKISTDDVLRLTKLCADEIAGTGREGESGITVGKILDTEPPALREGFGGLLDTLSKVVAFLREEAGLMPVNLRAEVIVAIAFAARFQTGLLVQQEMREKVLHWYWARLFSQRYDFGSTNNLLVDDSRRLLAWVRGDVEGIEGVTDFWNFNHPRVGVFDPEVAFRKPRSGNKSLAYGVLALQVAEGAMDWSTGNLIRGIPEMKLQVHHIFPTAGNAVADGEPSPPSDEAIEGMIADEGFDDDDGLDPLEDALELDEENAGEPAGDGGTGGINQQTFSKDAVFNFAVLEQPTNARISKHPPHQIVTLEPTRKVQTPTREYIESSLIRLDTMADWGQFQQSRVELLSDALRRRIPAE